MMMLITHILLYNANKRSIRLEVARRNRTLSQITIKNRVRIIILYVKWTLHTSAAVIHTAANIPFAELRNPMVKSALGRYVIIQ